MTRTELSLQPIPIEPLNPTLHRGQSHGQRIDRMGAERVLAGALPVLCSFPVLAPYATGASTVLKGRALLLDLVGSVRRNEGWRAIAQRAGHLAGFLGVAILAILNRSLSMLCSNLLGLLSALRALGTALLQQDRSASCQALFAVASSMVQLWAVLAGGSLAAMVCAGCFQVLGDLVSAAGLAHGGAWYEAVMLLVAAGLRGQSLIVPGKKLARDLTSRAATEDDLKAITAGASRQSEGLQGSGPVRLDDELRRRGLSWRVRQLDLSNMEMSGLELQGVTFERCTLEGTAFAGATLAHTLFQNCDLRHAKFQNAALSDASFVNSVLVNTDFSGAKLERTAFLASRCALASFRHAELHDVSFKHCELSWSNWSNSSLHNVHFANSWLGDSSFADARLQQTSFEGCDLTYVLMNDADLQGVQIRQSVLEATCFLGARVKQSTISHSLGVDVLFCETERDWTIRACSIERTARPVIAMSWAPQQPLQFGAYAYRALREQGAVVLRFDMHAPQVSAAQLKQETLQGLAQIQAEGLREGMLSRADQLVRNPQGLATAELVHRAQQVAKFSDGILLPGGWDIEPELYGQQRLPDTACTEVWTRSILEMALLREAVVRDLPVMGICRGMQMLNVYHGGTLNQDARPFAGSFHVINPNLELPPEAIAFVEAHGIRSEDFYGYSCHHQAIDQLGKGMEKAATGEGLIKAIISRNGQFFGTQFHPELCSQVDFEALEKIRGKLQEGNLDEEKALKLWEAYQSRYGTAEGENPKEALLEQIALLQQAAQVWTSILRGFVGRAAERRSRSGQIARDPHAASERAEAVSVA
jgi:gamma-glutamyl-gamma-aminobutyrate hydrolase PuuD